MPAARNVGLRPIFSLSAPTRTAEMNAATLAPIRIKDETLLGTALMTFYSRPIHQAVATSSALAVLISIPGALGYVYAGWPAAVRYPDVAALQLPFAVGYVSLIGALLVIPTSLVTAPLGVRAAHAMSKRTLEMAFGCYLFIVGSRFVISLL